MVIGIGQNTPAFQLLSDFGIQTCDTVVQLPPLERPMEVLKCLKFPPLKPWLSITVSPCPLSALPPSLCPCVSIHICLVQ